MDDEWTMNGRRNIRSTIYKTGKIQTKNENTKAVYPTDKPQVQKGQKALPVLAYGERSEP